MAKLFGIGRAQRGSDAPVADGEGPAADACEEHAKQRRPLSQPGGGQETKRRLWKATEP